jgi:myo-inositol 2-dehydrogenase / D-chiro-inositol 1-dehydrogenase
MSDSEEKIDFAFLGVASHHCEFIARAVQNIEGASLVGVYDQDQVKGKKFADKFDIDYYSDADELLSIPRVKIGVVTSENARKKDLAILIARANKHVICDKPLGLTAEDSREIMRACKRSNVRLQVGYVSRYIKEAQEAKMYLASGKLGTIRFINAENRVDMGLVKTLSPWLLQESLGGGGALLEHSVHAIDLALWFNETTRPVSAYAISAPNLDPECEGEDNFTIMIRFANGSIATVDGSYCRMSSGTPGGIALKVTGDKGKDELKLSTSNLELGEYSGQEPSVHSRFYSRGISTLSETRSGELMVRGMLESIRTGEEPLTSGAVGERVNEVVDASYRSLETGKEMPI